MRTFSRADLDSVVVVGAAGTFSRAASVSCAAPDLLWSTFAPSSGVDLAEHLVEVAGEARLGGVEGLGLLLEDRRRQSLEDDRLVPRPLRTVHEQPRLEERGRELVAAVDLEEVGVADAAVRLALAGALLERDLMAVGPRDRADLCMKSTA